METEIDKLYCFQECEGFRKGSNLLYIPETQQLYCFRSNTNGAKRYVCYSKGCKKSVVVDFENSNICRVPIGSRGEVHNHPTQEIVYKNMKIANSIKERCANSTLQKSEIRQIFHEECSKTEKEIVDLQFGRMQRQLINIRNRALPKCPTNSAEVCEIFKNQNVIDSYGMSRHKKTEKFYQSTIIESQFSYTIFMSPTIAEEIRKQSKSSPREYVIDATFSAVPSCGYEQLLIIHFCYKGQVYPLFYILMSSKNEESYRHVFEYIEANLFTLEPYTFVTNFEEALRNGLRTVYPATALNTSWFHFCREIRRRAKEIPQFRSVINSNLAAKRIFKKLLSLPLLKPADIVSGFELLKMEANRLANLSQFNELFEYFQNQWMEKETPFTWSVHGNAIKTTNELDNFNRQLSQQLAKSGNFFKFIECLLKQDLAKSKDIVIAVDANVDVSQPPKKKLKKTNILIQEMTNKLDRHQITINDFLTQITNSKNSILIIENSCSFDVKYPEINDDINNGSRDEINHKINCEINHEISHDINHDLSHEMKKEIVDDTDVNNSNSDNLIHEANPNIQEPIILCAICGKNPRTILVQPCNHFKLCSTCFEEIAEKYTKYDKPILCPACRQVVQNSTTIFL